MTTTSINSSPLFCFGFHSLEGYDDESKSRLKINNYANFFGYIPIVGTIVGLARIIFNAYLMTKSEDDEEKELYKIQILRGTVECFSCGIIFLIPDLIITRKHSNPTQSSEEN
jgi:hypothetical protein